MRGRQPPLAGVDTTVLQVSDVEFAGVHEASMWRIRRYAASSGASYWIAPGHGRKWETNGKYVDPHDCVYGSKVSRMREALSLIPNGSWLVFLDADVLPASPHCDLSAFARLVANFQAEAHGTSCWLAVQEDEAGLDLANTGVVAVQRTREAEQLLAEWSEEQSRINYCRGPADQLAFYSVLLRRFVPRLDCDTTNFPHGSPGHSHLAAAFNSSGVTGGFAQHVTYAEADALVTFLLRCFNSNMIRAGFAIGNRSKDGLCLINGRTHRQFRFNMHDNGGFASGDLFMHRHKPDFAQVCQGGDQMPPHVEWSAHVREQHQNFSLRLQKDAG